MTYDVGLYGFFFFQAEDGIRDYKVTGVQTCALPIYLQVPIRYRMTNNPSSGINVALHASPGVTFYSNNGSTLFGIGGPVRVVVGSQGSDSLTPDGGVDIPGVFSITKPPRVVFRPLAGGRGEDHV